MLLHNNADPNIQDGEGWTPLHWAVQSKNKEFCQILVEFGSSPEASDYEGVTPMSMARAMNMNEIISVLANSKAPTPPEAEVGGCTFFGFCNPRNNEPTLLPSKSRGK